MPRFHFSLTIPLSGRSFEFTQESLLLQRFIYIYVTSTNYFNFRRTKWKKQEPEEKIRDKFSSPACTGSTCTGISCSLQDGDRNIECPVKKSINLLKHHKLTEPSDSLPSTPDNIFIKSESD